MCIPVDISTSFIKIWNHQIDSNFRNYKDLASVLSPILQMLITSDGSLTRHNTIINNENTTVEIIREICSLTQKTNIYHNKTENKRFVWLVGSENKRIFAHSYWNIIQRGDNFIDITQPIGKELIKNEVNIHRDLLSIYIGYCHDIEKQFNHNGLLWGRSYKINVSHLSPIFIHEIFSPSLIKSIQ